MRLSVLLLLSGIPLVNKLLFPALLVRNFSDPIFDNRQSLPNLVVLHVLFVVKLVSKLKQIINLLFLGVLLHLLRNCPSRLSILLASLLLCLLARGLLRHGIVHR